MLIDNPYGAGEIEADCVRITTRDSGGAPVVFSITEYPGGMSGMISVRTLEGHIVVCPIASNVISLKEVTG